MYKDLLALDPGGSTGFAVYSTEDCKTWKRDKLGVRNTLDNRNELFQLLRNTHPDILVCENFRLFPWKSKSLAWSQLIESRIIGVCELYADEHEIPLVMQSTDNRDIGYKWGQVTRVPKSNPANHAYDAAAHGVFYIIKNGGVVRSD